MYYLVIGGAIQEHNPTTLPTPTDLGASISADELDISGSELAIILGYTPVPNTRTVNGHTLSANVTVTKGDVGLSSVDNTADSAKPVSSAVQSALDAKATSASLSSHTGDTANPHSVTKTQVGLGSADNTSDAQKPVSTAQQTALDLKADAASALLAAIVTPSSPTTGETVSAATNKPDETLYITPAGTLLALTVALPTAANSKVGQIIRGMITQIITGLTVSVSGGGAVVGSTPVTSAVNSTFAYQCASVAGAGTWIRIY